MIVLTAWASFVCRSGLSFSPFRFVSNEFKASTRHIRLGYWTESVCFASFKLKFNGWLNKRRKRLSAADSRRQTWVKTLLIHKRTLFIFILYVSHRNFYSHQETLLSLLLILRCKNSKLKTEYRNVLCLQNRCVHIHIRSWYSRLMRRSSIIQVNGIGTKR